MTLAPALEAAGWRCSAVRRRVRPVDWKFRAGYMAEFFPLQFPAIPGNDAAGVVDGLGQGVEGTSLGDPVFGTTMLEGSAEARRAVRVGADPAGRGADGLLDTAGFGSLGTLFTIVGTPGRSRASPTSALRPSVLDSSTV